MISSRLTSPRPPLCLDTRWHTTTSTTTLRASPWSWWAETPDNNGENLTPHIPVAEPHLFQPPCMGSQSQQKVHFFPILPFFPCIISSRRDQSQSKPFVSLHCRLLSSKMIPLLGYMAVKYLINYPRFLLTTLPSYIEHRYEQLGVKQKFFIVCSPVGGLASWTRTSWAWRSSWRLAMILTRSARVL